MERIRQNFVAGGLDWALTERPRPGAARKLDGKAEAFLVATACSAPPAGRGEWTMHLLADRLVEVGLVEEISDETVRRTLKKRGQALDHGAVVHPDGECGVCLEHGGCAGAVCGPDDPLRPLVCFDEMPYQLVSEVRAPVPAAPGQLERYDYEYRREGTCNLFVFFAPGGVGGMWK